MLSTRSDAAARLVRRAIVTMGALPDAALRDALVRDRRRRHRGVRRRRGV